MRSEAAALAAALVFGACTSGVILLLASAPDAALLASSTRRSLAPVVFLAVALPLLAVLAAAADDWRRGVRSGAALGRAAIACAIVVGALPVAAWGLRALVPLWQLIGLFIPPFALAVATGFIWGGAAPTARRCVRQAVAAYVGLLLPLLVYVSAYVLTGRPHPERVLAPSVSPATFVGYLLFGAVLVGLSLVPMGGLVGGYLRAGRLPEVAG
jgi:hypothetical protein